MKKYTKLFFLWDYWHDNTSMKFFMVYGILDLKTQKTYMYLKELDLV